MPRLSARAGVQVALAAFAVVVASPAAAASNEGATIAIDLAYDAPSSCPTRDDLLRAIDDRNAGPRQTDNRTFRVHIESLGEGRGFDGQLEVAGNGRADNVRRIHATTCAAAVRSLAMFVAIALDPRAMGPTSLPSPKAPSPAIQSAKGVERSKRFESAKPVASPARGAPRTSWQLGAGMRAVFLTAPGGAWGGRVHVELAREPASHTIAPAVRLSWGWADFFTVPPIGGEASFRFRTARVEGCLGIDLAKVVLLPCAMAELGALSGKTAEVARSGQAAFGWSAGGLASRVRVPLLEWLAVEADVGALVPFRRKTFALSDPYREVYGVPPLLFELGASLVMTARFGPH